MEGTMEGQYIGYHDTLPKLKEAIRKKRSGHLGSGVLLLDDSAMATQNHIATLGWERLHHPPYSPDLASSDFHLFPALKKNLTGRHFGSNAEVKQAVKRSSACKALNFSLRVF
ncbi:histone-lysine N-methyltransferase SETMAR [Trichonephila clavipes]|nr:histone-lysine N-methyltransferase SETMAR [Trichonephila clavipes]